MKSLLFYTLFIFLPLTSFGQLILSGNVIDKTGEPVIGANVYIENTYDGTSSDINGTFTFKTSATGKQTLVVTFVGYEKFTLETFIGKSSPTNYSIVLHESINRLDAVVITAGSFSASEESNREVLETLDIVTTAGATADIAGALNTLPGTQTVGEQGRLFVRGGSGYETRTFIDGLEVLDSYSPSAPQTPTRGRFSPFMFAGTSFSTGGYSAEYGQALSSALILSTKGVAVQDRTDISLMSVGLDVAHSETFENSSISAKVGYTNLTPYFQMVKQKINYNQAPISYESNFAYRQKTENGTLKLYGNLNYSSLNIYRPQILESSIEDEIGVKNLYSYLNANYSSIINDRWSQSFGLSFTNSTDDLRVSSLNINDDLRGLHAKSVFYYDTNNKFSLKTGVENYIHSNGYEVDTENASFNYTRNLTSTFVEADYYLSNAIVLRGGLRMEIDDLEKHLFVVPRLSIARKLGENGQVSLAYGKFNQSPQPEYLRVTNQLKSEKADHYIANYQIIEDGRTFRIEGYYKRYKDLVKFDNLYQSQTYSNNGEGYAMGFDVFWRDNKSIDNLDYWVSYSFLDTKRDFEDFPDLSVPDFSSRHNFSVVTKYFISDIKTQVGLTYSYASPRPYNDPNRLQFNGERTPAYHDLSFNLSYLYRPNIIIHTSVANALGIKNIFGYEWSEEKNDQGLYVGRPITLPAPRFIFLGVFITLSSNKSINQLPNL